MFILCKDCKQELFTDMDRAHREIRYKTLYLYILITGVVYFSQKIQNFLIQETIPTGFKLMYTQ